MRTLDIPVMILIIVCVFAFIVLMAWLIRRNNRSKITVSYNGELMYRGKPLKLDEHEKAIS